MYFKEYSKETEPSDIPYYPKRLEADKKLLTAYRQLAEQENNVSFLGRLATYRYLDMGPVIAEALRFADDFLASLAKGARAPVLPNNEDWRGLIGRF